jgi:hypothetical protein
VLTPPPADYLASYTVTPAAGRVSLALLFENGSELSVTLAAQHAHRLSDDLLRAVAQAAPRSEGVGS